jgi:hypothetical protein
MTALNPFFPSTLINTSARDIRRFRVQLPVSPLTRAHALSHAFLMFAGNSLYAPQYACSHKNPCPSLPLVRRAVSLTFMMGTAPSFPHWSTEARAYDAVAIFLVSVPYGDRHSTLMDRHS